MVNRVWIGGGNNKADNPNDWTPGGAPQSGDNLTMASGTTMKVTGNDLAGNVLGLNGTLELSKEATANVEPLLSGGSNTINIADTDTLTYHNGFFNESSVTINLAANSKWIGSFNGVATRIVINGGPHSSFENQSSGFFKGGNAKVNVDVTGTGTFNGDGIEFVKSVGAGQDVTVGTLEGGTGPLILDDPRDFLGSITMHTNSIDLIGLAKADSYTFQNDMLSIFAGHTVIDTLRLTVALFVGNLAVLKAGSNVIIASDTSGISGTPLPIHTFDS